MREKKLVRNLQDMRPLNELAAEQGIKIDTVILKQKEVEADRIVSDYLEIKLGAPVLEVVRMRYIKNGTLRAGDDLYRYTADARHSGFI